MKSSNINIKYHTAWILSEPEEQVLLKQSKRKQYRPIETTAHRYESSNIT